MCKINHLIYTNKKLKIDHITGPIIQSTIKYKMNMCMHIDKIDEFDPDFSYTLIYGDNQYYIQIIDVTASDPIKIIKFSYNVSKPKHISQFAHSQYMGYWHIIDECNDIHLLMITNNGDILLKISVYSAPIGNTLLSTCYVDNSFVMYYMDKDNMLKRQNYDCSPYAPKHCNIIKCGAICTIRKISSHATIEYVCNSVYIKTKNNLYCLLSSNNNKVDDYGMRNTGAVVTHNKNLYVHDICSNSIYKNNKIVHTFKSANIMLEEYHSVNDLKKLILMFVSNDHITYLIDDNQSVIIREIYIGNIKFVDNTAVQSLLNCKSRLKKSMTAFMLAIKVTKQKIPRVLIHRIISMVHCVNVNI